MMMTTNGNGKNAATRKKTVTLYPSGKRVEVAPGLRVTDLPHEHAPEIALVRMQPVGDGSYKPVLQIYDSEVRASHAAKLLNMPYRTILRLFRGGFLKGSQPSPGLHLIDLPSWFEHVAAVRADPEFWLKEKNRRRYREAL